MTKTLLATATTIALATGMYAADGDTFSFEGLNYTILSEADKTCEVGKNSENAEGEVVIPEYAISDGTEYKVTALGTDAFYLNIPMTSISIPETVTVIRSQALSRCLGLTEVIIPNSVTEMDSRAMYACNYLERLTISSGMREINPETFSGCPWLEEIIIPDGVEIIYNEAFNYCGRATKLDLGSTVTSIGKMAFAGCGYLKEVNIPASVREVGEEAFGYCPSIGTVTIEESNEEISFGINAFGDSRYAHDPDVVAKINTLTINRPFTCISTVVNELPFAKKTTLESVNIGTLVTDLPADTFSGCDNISAVNVAATQCPSASSSTFSSSIFSKALLSVPENSVEAYRQHNVWGRFSTIKGVPSGDTAVSTLDMDNDGETEYYDLNGRRINSQPPHGIYLIKKSNLYEKVIL